MSRLAENQKRVTPQKFSSHSTRGKDESAEATRISTCAVHPTGNHKTENCRDFKQQDLDGKYQLLRKAHVCFRCFQPHRRDKCQERRKCEHCNRDHHSLLCRQAAVVVDNVDPNVGVAITGSYSARSPTSLSLYAIQQVLVINSGREATVFCDSGSNSTYITHRAAQRLKAEKLDKCTLEVTTMGNQEKTYETNLYEVSVKTITGKIVQVQAYGMQEITGPVSVLDKDCLISLFPDRDPRVLQRKSTTVDILLGCDYFGLHPKHEVCSNGHLSIMQGELGVCLQGSH